MCQGTKGQLRGVDPDAQENLRATFLQSASLTGTESMYHLFIITHFYFNKYMSTC